MEQEEDVVTTLLSESWGEFLESLRAAGETALGPDGARDDLERSEAIRFLTRLTSASLDMLIEYGDTAHPEFVRLMTEHRKFYGDNPDTDYDYASVRGHRRYRISGIRGTSEYLACCVYGRDPEGATRIVANVSDRDMVIDGDGRFELVLSIEPPPDGEEATWIPTAPDVDTVIMRQYFLDRASETPATFAISCRDDSERSSTLGPETLARRMRAAGRFVDSGMRFSAAAANFLARRPNVLSLNSETRPPTFYPTPDNKYVGGWYCLDPNEALVVEGRPPDARYWSVLLMSRWMESLDQRGPRSSLNKNQIQLEDDGTFRVVVAARDPGLPNWLPTLGHRQGYVLFRWMQATDVSAPNFRVISLPDVESC